MFLLLFNLALAPGLFLLIIFYFVDREREPMTLIFATFFVGMGASIPVVIMEVLAKSLFAPFAQTVSPQILQISYMFLVVAPVEEVLKFGAVMAVVFASREFNEWYDGILYAMVASLGFATLENIFYVVSLGVGVGMLRFVLSVPAHALFGGIMGFFLSGAKFSRRSFPWLIGALFFPISYPLFWISAILCGAPTDLSSSAAWLARPQCILWNISPVLNYIGYFITALLGGLFIGWIYGKIKSRNKGVK